MAGIVELGGKNSDNKCKYNLYRLKGNIYNIDCNY